MAINITGIISPILNFFKARSELNSFGEIFKAQLSSSQNDIHGVIKSIDEHIQATNNSVDRQICLIRENKFDTIKSLDKFKVIKYYQEQPEYRHQQDSLEKASQRVSSIYYSISSFIEETKSVAKISDEYLENIKKLILGYKECYDVVRRQISVFADSTTEPQRKQEALFQKYVELTVKYHKDNTITKEHILSVKDTFHKELFAPPFENANSILYKQIFDFNCKARDLINHFEAERKEYLDKLKNRVTAMKEVYKNLYKEEYRAI